MQLHVCLLLFIITTDKTLALLPDHCGGNVSLDQQPAGHINLTVPGLLTDSNDSLQVCTWTLGVPLGRSVLLKLVCLERGSSVSVSCVLSEGARVLDSGADALLSGCDGNKATLIWTGAGLFSNEMKLSYYVQEDERNSSEDHTSPHSDLQSWSQTGTSFTSAAPVGQEAVEGTEEVRGRLHEGLERSSVPQSASGPSSQDQGLLHPSPPLQGLTVAGRTDREAPPLPEEETNNGADTPGAAHLADGEMSARERTHPYFEHTLSTDKLFPKTHTENTETNSSKELLQTQMAWTHETASSSNTVLGTGVHENTATSKLSSTTEAHSSSSIPLLTSSPPELPSQTAWESDSIRIPHGGAVSGEPTEKLPHSWRNQRSTLTLHTDLTSTVTSSPSQSPIKPEQEDSSSTHAETRPTASSPSPSSSQGDSSGTYSSTTHLTEHDTAAGTVEAASLHPNVSRSDSSVSAASHVASQTDESENTEVLHTSSTQTQANSPQSTESLTHSPPPDPSSRFAQTHTEDTQTATQSTQADFNHAYTTSITVSSVSDISKQRTLSFTGSSSAPKIAVTMGDVLQDLSPAEATSDSETHTLHPSDTTSHTHSQTPAPLPSSSTSTHSSTAANTPQSHTAGPGSSQLTNTPLSLPSTTTGSTAHTPLIDNKIRPIPSQTPAIIPTFPHTPHTHNPQPLPSSTPVPATHKQPHNYITTTHTSLLSITTAKSDEEGEGVREDDSWQFSPISTTVKTPTAGPPSWTTSHPGLENNMALTPSVLTSTTSLTPKYYIVPDQPAAVRVESIELLLQIIVEESKSAVTSGLEEDTTAWVEPYLHRAPGFSRLLGVWSRGNAVQSLLEFKTSDALQWLSRTGPTSLLERTGLSQAVSEGRSFRSSKITNITLGGLQGDVCDWLLQCPAGFKCVFQPGSSNYSCSSVCHFDYCHHHGICTHHPGQLPVCRCLVGEDFWFMGQRCDMRMTRARLVGACLAILLIIVTVIAVLALVAVRRYRAILIQAKVDQTRSSYRRFNHFDELSGRFWLRSWAGSADSLDNPAFTRSDELLHLRALDRPCCYHDDTLSLASTCPSHGTRINTIYPHSSQYGWRGSEMSVGDGVLDSGKASDLSVCSWPVEPIHWTPFPLLQQLASHRTPTVRLSRPRSYCEGMELVDMGKSWTA